MQERHEANLNSIPEECPLTLEHVQVHLSQAEEEEKVDPEQYAHNLSIAGRILLAMVYKLDLVEGRYN